MREIKFRAWHKNREQWVDLNAHFSFDTLGKLYQTDFKPIELMQYTGLKDKNGKEIYEGDLFKPDMLISPNCLEVKYDDTGSFWPFGNDPEAHSPRLGEVIGNIYENPELLK